jgi:hypothetical protein
MVAMGPSLTVLPRVQNHGLVLEPRFSGGSKKARPSLRQGPPQETQSAVHQFNETVLPLIRYFDGPDYRRDSDRAKTACIEFRKAQSHPVMDQIGRRVTGAKLVVPQDGIRVAKDFLRGDSIGTHSVKSCVGILLAQAVSGKPLQPLMGHLSGLSTQLLEDQIRELRGAIQPGQPTPSLLVYRSKQPDDNRYNFANGILGRLLSALKEVVPKIEVRTFEFNPNSSDIPKTLVARPGKTPWQIAVTDSAMFLPENLVLDVSTAKA